ncbi:uncharacterized protein LOC135118478 [Helicoverpa armigera]|uniref:uncharacterized protein LOC135118478 n=1 Tax=Helicoverpa armigera TaxID=29058 RepID=UPI003083E444
MSATVRTPAKKPATTPQTSTMDTEKAGPSTQKLTQASNVRRSIGEWEAVTDTHSQQLCPSQTHPHSPKATDKLLVPVSPRKTKQKIPPPSVKRASGDASGDFSGTSPVSRQAPANNTNRVSQARSWLQKVKYCVGESRNLRTDLKAGIIAGVDNLYQLVKDATAEATAVAKTGTATAKPKVPETKEMGVNTIEVERDIESWTVKVDQMQENIVGKELIKLIKEQSEKIDITFREMEKIKDKLSDIPKALPRTTTISEKLPHTRSALHSIVVASKDGNETGDEVLDRVRKAVDAKEGWVKVERVRKAKDRKIIMGFETTEDRSKIKERLEKEGINLAVEEVKNRDPLLILKDVLLIHTDEEVLKVVKNQNREIFHDLGSEDQRMNIRYRRRTRNPHLTHIVLSVSPTIWRRALDAEKIRIDLQRVRVEDQTPLVQCTRCLGYGHGKRLCKEPEDLCSHCGGPHLRAKCADWLAAEQPSCRNCQRAKLDVVNHNAFSVECPVRKKWDNLARSTVAYC